MNVLLFFFIFCILSFFLFFLFFDGFDGFALVRRIESGGIMWDLFMRVTLSRIPLVCSALSVRGTKSNARFQKPELC